MEDRAGTIWSGSDRGLFRLRSDGAGRLVLERAGLEEAGEITSLEEDAPGALWIGTSSGLDRRAPDGSVDRYTTREGLPDNVILSVLADRDGRIWAGTRAGIGLGGLAMLMLELASQRPVVRHAYTVRDGLPSGWINQLAESSDGAIWAATAGGLVRVLADAAGRSQFRIYGQAHGLPSDAVLSIAEDRHRRMWVGTKDGVDTRGRLWAAHYTGGLGRIEDAATAHPRFFRHTTREGLSSNEVTAAVEDQQGNIYVATARLGVNLRRDLYLIFKEAINNAVRHAGCSAIGVQLRGDAARLVLSVTDDGAGFEVSSVTEGNGLLSMRRRAERLGAQLRVESQPGAGTCVIVEIRRARRRVDHLPERVGDSRCSDT